jgi:hypothetical protein
MWELLARGKNTIDPGCRSVEDSPVKSDFTFTFTLGLKMLLNQTHGMCCLIQIVVLRPILFFINVLNNLCIIKRPI